MKTITVLLAVAVGMTIADGNCPAYRDWRAWTDECLWFPMDSLRDGIIRACDVKIDTSKLPAFPALEGLPGKCGHCSFKARCRKRERQDGCAAIDIERQPCNEHGDVCAMPQFPLYNLGCRYEMAPLYLAQCANRAGLADWKRAEWMRMVKVLPKFHCTEVEGACKCCCHPYEPSEDGTSCVEIPEPECPAFPEMNEWSEKCMWFPPDELRDDFVSHCDFQMPDNDRDKAKELLKKLPEGFQFPEKCGYCSFKIKCAKRSDQSAAGNKECFPLKLQKKACGPDDCETCGNVCVVDKMMGSCNITDNLRKLIGPGLKSRMKKMPHGMREGLTKMISHLPHGRCIEKDDKCHCCCHPYDLNADGTSCVLKNICKDADDLGVEIDMNLEPASFWF